MVGHCSWFDVDGRSWCRAWLGRPEPDGRSCLGTVHSSPRPAPFRSSGPNEGVHSRILRCRHSSRPRSLLPALRPSRGPSNGFRQTAALEPCGLSNSQKGGGRGDHGRRAFCPPTGAASKRPSRTNSTGRDALLYGLVASEARVIYPNRDGFGASDSRPTVRAHGKNCVNLRAGQAFRAICLARPGGIWGWAFALER